MNKNSTHDDIDPALDRRLDRLSRRWPAESPAPDTQRWSRTLAWLRKYVA
ncbi:MAG TPA: hypothetical protein VFJ58_20085 [Armatimonadota bacterium]|nr:hypothetical protein [Armatimonadota bacterium]